MASGAFDKLIVWDDLLTARSLMADIYMQKPDIKNAFEKNRDLADLKAVLFV